MHGSISGRTLPFPMALASEDRELDCLPTLPSEREMRRARLVGYLARRRMRYQLLHIALGLAGWGLIGVSVWGIARLAD